MKHANIQSSLVNLLKLTVSCLKLPHSFIPPASVILLTSQITQTHTHTHINYD